VIFGKGKTKLFLGVHDDGTTPGYWFAQGLARYQKEFGCFAGDGRSFYIFGWARR